MTSPPGNPELTDVCAANQPRSRDKRMNFILLCQQRSAAPLLCYYTVNILDAACQRRSRDPPSPLSVLTRAACSVAR